MRSWWVLLVIVLVAAACAAADPEETVGPSAPSRPSTPPTTVEVEPGVTPQGETIDGSLTAPDGTERTYHVYVPDSLGAGEAVPLLIALHGGTGWGLQFQATSGFDELAEANGFLVAYPDGSKIASTPESRVWNGGNCCGPAQQDRDDVDDVGFISALIDELADTYDVDPARVFAAGHSNGAILSYRLACELSDKVVAVAFQAGSLEIDRCEPDHPVSVFHAHGAADLNLPIGGGTGQGISGVAFASPVASVEALAAANDCPSTAVEVADADNPDVSRRVWMPCAANTAVEFVTVGGASHAWMGQPSRPAQEAISGVAYQEFDSALAIWTFLSAHPRPGEQQPS